MLDVTFGVSLVSLLSSFRPLYAHFYAELSKLLPIFSKNAIIEKILACLLNNVRF